MLPPHFLSMACWGFLETKRLDVGFYWGISGPGMRVRGKNWKKVRTSTLLMRGRRLLDNDSSNMGDEAFHPVSLPHLSRDPNLTSPNNLPPPHP